MNVHSLITGLPRLASAFRQFVVTDVLKLCPNDHSLSKLLWGELMADQQQLDQGGDSKPSAILTQRVSLWRAEFADYGLEQELRVYLARGQKRLLQRNMTIAGLVFASFAFADIKQLGIDHHAIGWVVGLRVLLGVLALYAAWVKVPKLNNYHQQDRMAVGMTLFAFVDFFVVIYLSHHSPFQSVAGFMIMLVGSYFFMPNRFVNLVTLGVLVSLTFVLVVVAFLEPTADETVNLSLMLSAMNLICAWPAHQLALSGRVAFSNSLRLRSILDASPYPIVILSEANPKDILFYNERGADILNWQKDSSGQNRPIDLIWEANDREAFLTQLKNSGHVGDAEMRLIAAGDVELWGLLSGTLMTYRGQSAYYLTFNDISDRREMEQKLYKLATTDGLTGALNRRHFMERGLELVYNSRRHQHPLSVMILDADHFKKVNDTHGHATGDRLLQQLSVACRKSLRETDLFGRIGGEEFAVLLPDTELLGAKESAERLRKDLSELAIANEKGDVFHFTVSVGVAKLGTAPESIEGLMHRADLALYNAKHNGRNRVEVAET